MNNQINNTINNTVNNTVITSNKWIVIRSNSKEQLTKINEAKKQVQELIDNDEEIQNTTREMITYSKGIHKKNGVYVRKIKSLHVMTLLAQLKGKEHATCECVVKHATDNYAVNVTESYALVAVLKKDGKIQIIAPRYTWSRRVMYTTKNNKIVLLYQQAEKRQKSNVNITYTTMIESYFKELINCLEVPDYVKNSNFPVFANNYVGLESMLKNSIYRNMYEIGSNIQVYWGKKSKTVKRMFEKGAQAFCKHYFGEHKVEYYDIVCVLMDNMLSATAEAIQLDDLFNMVRNININNRQGFYTLLTELISMRHGNVDGRFIDSFISRLYKTAQNTEENIEAVINRIQKICRKTKTLGDNVNRVDMLDSIYEYVSMFEEIDNQKYRENIGKVRTKAKEAIKNFLLNKISTGTFHEEMSKLFLIKNSYSKEFDIKLSKSLKDLNDKEIEYNDTNYRFEFPKTNTDMSLWGRELRNCIGSYGYKFRTNEMHTNQYYFVLRNLSNQQLERCVEVQDRKVITQFYLAQNKKGENYEDFKKAVTEFLEKTVK